jgi:FkbH-like protein
LASFLKSPSPCRKRPSTTTRTAPPRPQPRIRSFAVKSPALHVYLRASAPPRPRVASARHCDILKFDEALMTPETAPAYRLAVCATFTVEPIAQVLSFWAAELDWTCELQFAPYNQVFQQLLDSTSLLAGNRNGVNLVLVRFEDWLRFGNSAVPGLADLADFEHHTGQLLAALHSAARSLPSPLLVCVCPASPAFLADAARRDFHRRQEQRVVSSLAGVSTVHLVTVAELDELYPVAEAHDPHADDLGHVPYTPEFFAALGTLLVRKIHALRVPPYKVIVLDCDDTLWKGVCGEDGPRGIVLDPARQALQEFMAAQHSAGRLLCLASKNNLVDVLDTFRMNPRMPLRLGCFTAWRINWAPKAAGLAELAEELELGLDSFILVDDNPKEVSEVQASHPEVLGIALPTEAGDIPAFLRHVWAFDYLRVTEVDQSRTLLYKQQIERGHARKQAASLQEFLASLQLDVHIAPMLPGELARVAQLTQRTNQLNFTTIRRSESEIQALTGCGTGSGSVSAAVSGTASASASDSVSVGGSGSVSAAASASGADPAQAECLAVHVRDRFGDYGLTGVMIFRAGPEALLADTFLLSCRALGRGVEHRMLAALGRIAAQRGLPAVEAPFVRTPGNLPALLFLESVGLEFQTVTSGNLSFRFPAAQAQAIRYEPGRAPRTADRAALEPPHKSSGDAGKPIPYVRIATELRDPREILGRIRGPVSRAIAPSHPDAPVPAASPRAHLERRLAEIWAETLGTGPVCFNDDFFDLGGHSLLAVQLMSRVRKEFDVELSLELVYSGAFTVTALAEAIELKEFERSGAEEYAALLREMEGLSDQEVRELLAREDEMPSH